MTIKGSNLAQDTRLPTNPFINLPFKGDGEQRRGVSRFMLKLVNWKVPIYFSLHYDSTVYGGRATFSPLPLVLNNWSRDTIYFEAVEVNVKSAKKKNLMSVSLDRNIFKKSIYNTFCERTAVLRTRLDNSISGNYTVRVVRSSQEKITFLQVGKETLKRKNKSIYPKQIWWWIFVATVSISTLWCNIFL